MIDEKSLPAQIDEFQVLIRELAKERLKLPNDFVVGSLIEKLSSIWKDFKMSINLEVIISHDLFSML